MANLSVIHGVNVPVRSISLPSRLQLNSIETELNELKTFGVLPGLQPSHGSGETGFTRLAKLYTNIVEIIQSPLTHKALHHQQNVVKLIEEALDDSVGLLDACSTAKDLITTMKQQVQDLQSALRRKGRDSSIGSDILAYINFRKKFKKSIGKSLRALKRLNSLKQSNAVTISMFESMLSFLSMPIMKTKAGGWSLISKLLSDGRNQKGFNEVGTVDFTLYRLHGRVRKNDAKIDTHVELRRLETLCATIEGFEDGLDCLFRCFIKIRVSLLNILTP
ncbi:hypothetical protein ES332_D03G004000v1 [Gossypium tomentosum]|uniref:Uncharacterized protein n=1 Tax=Gossypium tomentosum TaxID=34277 RepID=A0A5D2LJ90_GOSTO|nr:hypothetical protein ES332_D03G004000v1 [Gossypium tomentosum]